MVRSEPEVFAPLAEYARLRLADDPHLWASTLFDELTALGYAGSYPSFTRALRMRKLRPQRSCSCRAPRCCDRCDVGRVVTGAGSPARELSS